MIRFALAQAGPVSLKVFDLQGRRVATLLDHVFQEAGRHDVPVRADAWKPGVYLYRLKAVDPSTGVTRAAGSGKMMVLQ